MGQGAMGAALGLAIALVMGMAGAQEVKSAEYIRCMSHMENAVRMAMMGSAGVVQPGLGRHLRAGHECAGRAHVELTDEQQRALFFRAYEIFEVATETPSATAMGEFIAAAGKFTATLR